MHDLPVTHVHAAPVAQVIPDRLCRRRLRSCSGRICGGAFLWLAIRLCGRVSTLFRLLQAGNVVNRAGRGQHRREHQQYGKES